MEDGTPKASEDPIASPSVPRQRKKRKWDQPAESLITAGVALPGVLPLGVSAFPVSGALLINPAPGTFATVSQVFQSSSISQTAAIVQKLNQPKIQDELIAREIVINDAEPTLRYKLTKRQTQEEIQKSTGAVVITRGKYRPPNGLPDSEKPLYLHISASAHLKDTAERIKAVDRAASMVEEILKQVQNFLPASTPSQSIAGNGQGIQPLSTCVFVGFDTGSSPNIASRIHGPNDQYINHIMHETGATVILRGRDSGNIGISGSEETQQPLHLYLSSTSQKSLDDARILAENLLDTICAEYGATRISTCKVYGVVPPPQQLMAGAQSSAKITESNGSSAAGLQCPAAGCMAATSSLAPSGVPLPVGYSYSPLGTVLQSGGMPGYATPQPNMVSYSYPKVTGGTCYSGYGGIYPQATPLQQVALALRQAPASTPVFSSTSQPESMLLKKISSERDKKPPQKRKFQELPVPFKGQATHSQNLLQEEFLKPGSDDSVVRNVSSMPPPKKLVALSTGSNGMHPRPPSDMPPPPPKFPPPKDMPPPPPKFSATRSRPEDMPPPPPKFLAPQSTPEAESRYLVVTKSSDEQASDTLLKLVEYGGDDDDDDADADPSCEGSSNKSNRARSTTSKPFWAV